MWCMWVTDQFFTVSSFCSHCRVVYVDGELSLPSSRSFCPFEKRNFTFLQLMCHEISQIIYLWAVFFLFAQQCFLKSTAQEKKITRGYFRLGFKVHNTHPSLWSLLFIEWKYVTLAQTIGSNQSLQYSVPCISTKPQIQSIHNIQPL